MTNQEVKNQTEQEFTHYVSVKFPNAKKVYHFGVNDEKLVDGDNVVVETVRGYELGAVVGDVETTENLKLNTALKPVVRKATDNDLSQYENNLKYAKQALKTCEELVEKLGLEMNLISAEYTLDRSKVIIIYVADERVDFRDLLKELARALKCRIELRQIGPRDKAKLVGGLGSCGMETCCSRFKNNFDVISINMAKNQLLALNIQKLSGQCGKLMCCLKYEDELYQEEREGLPRLNAQIPYNGHKYRVTSMNILTQEAKLENKEETLFLPFEEAFKDYRKKERETQENENSEELSQ